MMELLDPTTEAASQPLAYAPRPERAGRASAWLWSRTPSSTRTSSWSRSATFSSASTGWPRATLYHKKNASVPAHEEIIASITKSCDVMVAGIGD